MTNTVLPDSLTPRDEREDGFTLIEILVVIIIIGILAAVATPIFLNQRKVAHDSALRTDLRNAATAVMTWQAGGNSNEELHKAAGTSKSGYQKKALYVIGEETEHKLNILPAEASGQNGEKLWNEAFPEHEITASDGVVMEVIMRDEVSAGEHLADKGEFCIVGSHNRSNYSYTYGSGSPTPTAPFLGVLFYDSALGGLKTMKELAEMPNGEEGGCGVHVTRYKKVVGAG